MRLKTSLIIPLVFAAAACASLTPKQKATATLQSVHSVLGTLQDTEMSLFAAGTIPQLTQDVHRQFHTLLVRAFDLELVTQKALLAWRATDPIPTSITELQAISKEILSFVGKQLPGAYQIVNAAQQVVDVVFQLLEAVRSRVPSPDTPEGVVTWLQKPPQHPRFLSLTSAFSRGSLPLGC